MSMGDLAAEQAEKDSLNSMLCSEAAYNECLRKALKLMLEDYRTEGCPDPDCGVCRRSQAAEKAARDALAEYGEFA